MKPESPKNTNQLEGNATKAPSATTIFHLGSGFTASGTITGQGMAVVDGFFEGSIQCDDIKVNANGRIVGDLTCRQLDAAGAIEGSIATENVLLRGTAKIKAVVHYESLIIEKGADFDGELTRRKAAGASDISPAQRILFPLSDDIKVSVLNAKSIDISANGRSFPKNSFELTEAGIVLSTNNLSQIFKRGEAIGLITLKLDDNTYNLALPRNFEV